MSGGSYNYIYLTLSQECAGYMNDAEMNGLIVDLCKVLHDLEWWQSCDSSEEVYRKSVAKFKEKWFNKGYKEPCESAKTDTAKPEEGAELIDRRKIKWYGCDHEGQIKEINCETADCSKCFYATVEHDEVMSLPVYHIPDIEKIRAQIREEAEFAYADFEQYKIEVLGVDPETVEDELPNDDFRYGMERTIEIINKHIFEEGGT